MKFSKYYRCPKESCNNSELVEADNVLHCLKGHKFSLIPGTCIPVFIPNTQLSNEYTHTQSTAFHDNSWNWVYKTFSSNETDLRTELASKLQLKPDDTVLITGAGTGNDIPFIAKYLNNDGIIFAQDLSREMLLEAFNRVGSFGNGDFVDVYYSVSDAQNLPFEDNFFDAAYHFGGLNAFSDIQKGITEMDRVVKQGGKVLICDEGIAHWLKATEIGKMLINNNPLYACEPPMHLIPPTAANVNLSWVLSHCFYVIDYLVSDNLPTVNLDIPHLGKRGGTIRSRYHGVLEGVNPDLKKKLYEQAEKQGISRVKFIEGILGEAVNEMVMT